MDAWAYNSCSYFSVLGVRSRVSRTAPHIHKFAFQQDKSFVFGDVLALIGCFKCCPFYWLEISIASVNSEKLMEGLRHKRIGPIWRHGRITTGD